VLQVGETEIEEKEASHSVRGSSCKLPIMNLQASDAQVASVRLCNRLSPMEPGVRPIKMGSKLITVHTHPIHINITTERNGNINICASVYGIKSVGGTY
jgi:hypothetical protein